MDEDLRIFTETSETLGLLYDSYKDLPDIIDKFLGKMKDSIDELLDDPINNKIDLKDDINKFKDDINKKFEPAPIQMNKIKLSKQSVSSIRSSLDKILNQYAKLRNKVSFGGNYFRAVIKRPKVYSKEVDYDSYEHINSNIRNVDRALDWIEKIIIDLYNMIDQDMNILTIVDKVYNKSHIYESGDINNEDQAPNIDDDEKKEESRPKQVDKAESNKNGVRRKKLYIAFIEWCKEYNPKNTFGSIFDKDAFKVSYPFVPEEMRYFYRLANPMLCVLAGKLTFFPVADLRKLNQDNNKRWNIMIFAATENDLRIFNSDDKKVYRATEKDGNIELQECLGNTFDLYIQNMIKKGDILNEPLEESVNRYNPYDMIDTEYYE